MITIIPANFLSTKKNQQKLTIWKYFWHFGHTRNKFYFCCQ
jgi:hypothetical protein